MIDGEAVVWAMTACPISSAYTPLEELWSINLGRDIDAPPTTYAVGGKQYIVIATGLSRNQVGKLANSPETKGMAKNATMIFVFRL